jgi:hypothetical protein
MNPVGARSCAGILGTIDLYRWSRKSKIGMTVSVMAEGAAANQRKGAGWMAVCLPF